MKKITFVEKDDSSSYDPVNTFFSKTKTSSVAKPIQNTKTTIQKSIQIKKQQKLIAQKTTQSIPQKIGQKGGSGYIPKKVPDYNSTQYEKLRDETIYDLKQKQKQMIQKTNKTTSVQQNSTMQGKTNVKRNTLVERKPDMVFDIVKRNDDEQNSDSQNMNINEGNFNRFVQKDQEQTVNVYQDEKDRRLPQIKSPAPTIKTNNRPVSQIKMVGSQNSSKNISGSKNNVKAPLTQQKQRNVKEVVVKQRQESDQSEIIKQRNESVRQPISNIPKPSTTMNKPKEKPSTLPKPPLDKQASINSTATKVVPTVVGKQKSSENTLQSQQRVKQLQSYQKEYQQKISQLQSRVQHLVKTQQKYQKLLKQHKQCGAKNKEYDQMVQELLQTKDSVKSLMSQPTIPFSLKRQHLLLNQLRQLKKTNRQLTLRIKNYKGSDLVQMAINRNKQQIGREFQVQFQQKQNQLNIQMESNLTVLVKKVYQYLDVKAGRNKEIKEEKEKQKKIKKDGLNEDSKGKITVDQEQKFLLEINSLAEKISLTFLQKYQVSPLPQCNEDCINLYAEIEKERQNILNFCSENLKLITKEELNFAITENNLQIINDINENQAEMETLQEKIINISNPQPKQKQKPQSAMRPSTSHNANTSKNTVKQTRKKLTFLLQIFKKRSSLSTAFHIQSVCYFTYLKQIISLKLSKLKSQLTNLYGRLKEMRDIFDLGGDTAKESLYLYLQTNLDNFCLMVSNLQCEVKEVKSSYKEISQNLNRKLSIKQY